MICRVVPIRFVLALITLAFVTVSALAQTNSAPAKVEVIQLKNGDRITGEILREDDDNLALKTRWNAELLVPKAEIEKREPQVTAVVTPAPEVAVAEPQPAPPAEMPLPAAEPVKPKGVWKGKVQLGADLRESTVSSYLYSANARVSYARGEWKTAADYRYSYGKSGQTVSADRMDGSLKTDLNLGQEHDWFVYALGGAGYDLVRKIDYQFEMGPGFGRHLLVRKDMALNVEAGLSYQQQNFNNGKKRDEMRFRVGQDYFWQINSKLKLEQQAEIQPALDDVVDYRIRFETTVSYVLFSNISWNVSVIDQYDSKPTNGVSNNDLQVRSGLGFSF